MPKRKPIQPGDRFARLVIIEEFDRRVYSSGVTVKRFLCRCDCGTEKAVFAGNLTSGTTTSCGCRHKELMSEQLTAINTTHGETSEPLYRVWTYLKQKCLNPNNPVYGSYGGRGISICPKWVESYESFRDWSLSSGYKKGYVVKRRNTKRGYEPKNCHWVIASESRSDNRNAIFLTAFGETKNINRWSLDPRCVVARTVLLYRAHAGWPHEAAITTESFGGRQYYRKN